MPADRDALLALAERVEREPHSFALECEIATALGIPGRPPPCTCSIDAAAWLMPDGWALHILERSDGAMMVEAIGADDEGVQSVVTGPHAEARARLAAALRARAAEAGRG